MKIACSHTFSKLLCVAENIKCIKEMLDVFKTEQVEYALFPELGVSGYLNSKELLLEYTSVHQSVKEQLFNLSTEYDFAFAVGLPWSVDNKWHIAQVVYKQGEIIGMHLKTHLSESEKKIFTEGNHINPVQLEKCYTGFQICLESHIPELSAIYQQKGIQLLSVPFASPRETPNEKLLRLGKMLQVRAYDNSYFVIACNSTGFNAAGKPFAGFSTIVSPRGNDIASKSGYEQGYIISDINLSEIEDIKESRMGYFSKIKRRNWLIEMQP